MGVVFPAPSCLIWTKTDGNPIVNPWSIVVSKHEDVEYNNH